jgi:hypothetical protein
MAEMTAAKEPAEGNAPTVPGGVAAEVTEVGDALEALGRRLAKGGHGRLLGSIEGAPG